MTRLAATLRCDVRLQWRNGFYYASAFVVAGSILVLRWLPEEALALLLPVFIFSNVVTNSFYFVSGLMLLENAEGTRTAQVVTPLRRVEYIAGKVVTLLVLSVVESLLIAALVVGPGPGLVPLAAGIALASVHLTLIGAAVVAPHRSINEFIMPSVLYTSLLSLPLLSWFDVAAPILLDWHPLQGPLALMGAGFAPLSAGRIAVAVVVPLLWLGPVYAWSRRAVARSVRA